MNLQKNYKIIISEQVQNKVKFLCKHISSVEWSGVLFYSIKENNFPHSLTLEAVDIYLMDIGNSTYTEFDFTKEAEEYMFDNELEQCYLGLIHSHNNFDVFFSGTDVNTLTKNQDKFIHFVSMIVNNNNDYTCAITYKEEYTDITTVKFTSYPTINTTLPYKQLDTYDEEPYHQYKKCLIDIEFASIDSAIPYENKEIEERIKEIKKRKLREVKTSSPNLFSYPYKYDRFSSYYKEEKEVDTLSFTDIVADYEMIIKELCIRLVQEHPTNIYFIENILSDYTDRIGLDSVYNKIDLEEDYDN